MVPTQIKQDCTRRTIQVLTPANPNAIRSSMALAGAPGEGLDDAPGLKKNFNPKSQACNNAGKK